MKKRLALLLALLALAFGTEAYAWGGHYGGGHHGYSHHGGHGYGHSFLHGGYYSAGSHLGFYIGAPLLWPRVEYYSDPYPVTQVIVERQPQVYVQRETPGR